MAKAVEDRYASAVEVQQDRERALAARRSRDRVDGAAAALSSLRARRERRRSLGRPRREPPCWPRSMASAVERGYAATDRACRLDSDGLTSEDGSWIACVAPTSTTTNGRCGGNGCCGEWCFRSIGLVVAAAVAFCRLRSPPGERAGRRGTRAEQHARVREAAAAGADARRDRRADQRSRERRRLLSRAAGKGPRSVHARLEGIPGVDLVMELFDAQGRRHREERRARPWPGRMAAADGDRPDGGLFRRARGLDRRDEADGERARSLHADRARGPPQPDWRAGTQRLAGGGDAVGGGGACAATSAAAISRLVLAHAGETGLAMGSANAPAGVDVIVSGDEGRQDHQERGAGDEEQFALEGEAGKPPFIGIAAQARRQEHFRRNRRCRVSRIRTSCASTSPTNDLRAPPRAACPHRSDWLVALSSLARWRPKRSAIRCSTQ